MEFPIEFSKNLLLTDICYLHTKKPAEKPVIMTFLFYGEECTLCLDRDHASSSWCSFRSMEAPSELSDSFENAIEYSHWDKVKQTYNQFIAEEDN